MKVKYSFLLFFAILIYSQTSKAQCNPVVANDSVQFLVSGYAPNLVNAMTIKDNILYFGGSFNTVGQYTGHFIGIDTALGRTVNTYTWPKINGSVYKAIPDGSGGWIIAGSFTAAGDSSRTNLAQIDASGHVTSFNPHPDNSVNSLLLVGSGLYVGGAFTHIAGVAKTRLAKISFPAGTVSSFAPNPNNTVAELEYYGGKLYAGGYFTNIGGQARKYIAAVDTTVGNAYLWNPNPTGSYVQTITFHAGLAYVGGTFNSIGGQPRNNIAALDTGTALATGWNPNAGGTVNKIIHRGATVYVAGTFGSIGTMGRNAFAEVDSAYGLATAFNPTTTISYPGFNDMAVSGNKIFLGGYYDYTVGLFSYTNYIGTIDIVGGSFNPLKTQSDNAVNTLGVSGAKVFAGGDFVEMGCKLRYNAAAIDLAADTITNWNPGPAGNVYAIAAGPSKVYIGGDFTTMFSTTTSTYYLVATDPSTGVVDPGFTPAIEYPSVVRRILYDDGNLYLAGNFTGISSYSRYGTAKLSASTGALNLAWNPAGFFSVGINALAADNSNIYLGGYFTSLGGALRNNLGAVDKVTGLATAWNPSPTSEIYDLSINNGKMIVGGYFNYIGGDSVSNLASVSLTTGMADSWNPHVNNEVHHIRSYYNTEYIAGDFDHLDTNTVQSFGSVNLVNNIPSSWNPHPGYDSVYDMAFYRDRIYVAGGFTTISGQNRYPALIVYKNPSLPDTISISGPDSLCLGNRGLFTAAAGAGFSYQWRVNGRNVGTGTDTFSYIPAIGDTIICKSTAPGSGCFTTDSAFSNPIGVVVTPRSVPAVSISGPDTICFGTTQTYIATSAIVSPSFIWRVGGISSGTGSTFVYTPSNGDIINCKIIPPSGCYTVDSAISNNLNIEAGLPVTPVISLDAPSLFTPWTSVTVTATVSNAGSSYQINWYKNGTLAGTTSIPVFTYTKGVGTDLISATILPLSTGCYDSATSNQVYVYEATEVPGITAENGINIFPNPFDENLTIKGLTQNDRICIYDINGTKIKEIIFSNPASEEHVLLNTLVPGVYSVCIRSADGIEKSRSTVSKL